MGRTSQLQTGFNSGEWSPIMFGRVDLDLYRRGLATCLNAVPLVQGPWTRRPGTAYLHQVKNHDETVRLASFRHNSGNDYILEFGVGYMRVFVAQGITVNASQSITGITKANPGVLSKVGHTYNDGDRIELFDIVGMHQVNGREVVVTNSTADTFELYDSDGNAIDTTNYGTFVSGNMAEIFEIATPYTAADLGALHFAQDEAKLYIFHEGYETRVLTRTSATSWNLADFDALDGPYLATNTTATTLSPSAATGTVTVTASAITGINDDQGFLSTDVGRVIRMQESSVWGWGEIISVSSTTAAEVAVVDTLTNTNAKTAWRLGLWSDTTGWPRTGTFHEDRLWVGGATTFPQFVNGSNVGLYTDFSPSDPDGTVTDSHAIDYPLNADDLHAVRWLGPTSRGLAVGTTRGEWLLSAGSTVAEVITPSNATGRPSTYHGSSTVQPPRVGSAILFCQRGARKMREFAYLFESDDFTAPDLTLIAEHILRPGISQATVQRLPHTIVWAVRDDGTLLGFTYERAQQVTAWHRHTLGGFSDAGASAAAKVESIALIPSTDGTRDELYLQTSRYIGGGTKRFIEYMTKFWETGSDDQEDAVHLDCAWTQLTTAATTTVSQLHFLEGESVQIYGDGARYPDQTVTNGAVTVSLSCSVLTVGYNYNSDGETLPLEGGSADGSSNAKIRRIHRVGFNLNDTLGLQYGPSADKLTTLLTAEWGYTYGQSKPLFSGLVRKRFESDYDLLGHVYWRVNGPFPATILSVSPQANVSDDS